MSYKTFRFNKRDSIVCRTGSEGFQRKFITQDNKFFIKEQCRLNGCYMNDWKVEVIASKLCDYFGFSHIEQTPCNVVVNDIKRYGVVSVNYRNLGYAFLSFEGLLEQINDCSNNDWFIRTNVAGKIYRMSEKISLACKLKYNVVIDINVIIKYMLECAIIDILVYNNDRHTRNYHMMRDNSGNMFTAPIHDCGMGLFENDSDFVNLISWEDCNRYCYISPFGEDAFDLLDILDKSFSVISWLRGFNRPTVSSNYFPSKKAELYFKEICNKIW